MTATAAPEDYVVYAARGWFSGASELRIRMHPEWDIAQVFMGPPGSEQHVMELTASGLSFLGRCAMEGAEKLRGAG